MLLQIITMKKKILIRCAVVICFIIIGTVFIYGQTYDNKSHTNKSISNYSTSLKVSSDLVDITNQAGTITAQGENPPNETMEKAFDNSIDTKWLDFAKANPTTRASWIQYQSTSGTYVSTQYTITSANDGPERDPKNWDLLGSNDGSTWTTLDTRTNEIFSSRYQKNSYSFTNTKAFTFYKLQINSVNDPVTATCVQLDEIEIFGNLTAEAEDANFGGGPWVGTDNVGYSGTGYLRNFEGINSYVEFSITGATAGAHDVTMHYTSGVLSSCHLYVNGVMIKQVNIPSTGGWSSWSDYAVNVTLNAGNNTIKFQHDADDTGYYYFDYLMVPGPSVVNVNVTGVTISSETLNITDFTSSQLIATVSPANVQNKTVSWTSSNTAVATVSSSGLVQGKSAGSTTITATTTDGGKTATCEVTVTASNGKSVVFMGNSITQFWSTQHPEFFDGKPYLNRGISGQTTSQMLSRFNNDVVKPKPTVVVIEGGTNDIAENGGPITLEKIAENISSMAQLAKTNGIQVVLSSVLPAYSFSWRPEIDPIEKIIALNELIKSYAEANGMIYADFYSALVSEDKGMIAQYTLDGVHPSKAGYEVMEPIVEEAIGKAISLTGTNSIYDEDENFKVFPNPVSGVALSIKLPEGAEILSITDVTGKIIYKKQVKQKEYLIDNSVFKQDGIYMVNIFTSEKSLTKKVIISK